MLIMQTWPFMKPSFSIGLALLLTVSRCPAQSTDYSFSKLDVRDGLSNNNVDAIYKDHQGFLWFGTISGVNRYDGYTCKVFRHSDQDSTTIENDNVTGIYDGPDGKIWMSSYVGIDIYDPSTERFERHPERFFRSAQLPCAINLPNCGLAAILRSQESYTFVYADSGIYTWDPGHRAACIRSPSDGHAARASRFAAPADPVNAAARDPKGKLWLVHSSGLLEQFDPLNHLVTYSASILPGEDVNRFRYSLYIDPQGLLWLFAPGSLLGLYQFDPATHSLIHFSKTSGTTALNSTTALSSNVVNAVLQDNSGLIWIATDQGGVDIFDKRSKTIRWLLTGEEPGSLAQNTIGPMYKDDLGIIWLGTYKKGVNFYHPDLTRFPLIHHMPGQPQSLPFNDVNRFAEDNSGDLWIGTNGGGLLRFNRKLNTFSTWQHNARDANSPAADVIVSLTIDKHEKLWIGYYQGGLDCFDGHRFLHYRHNDADTASLADDRVNAILEDIDEQLWIGTMGGLDRYDPQTRSFHHYKPNPSIPSAIKSSYISSLVLDARGDLWIGTAYGLSVLQKASGRFVNYLRETNHLSDNNINNLWIDSTGLIWVACRLGLNVLMPGTDTFRVFLKKDGLPDNATLNILHDGQGHLWVTTADGLSKITVSRQAGNITINCTNYDESDGLQGREFNVYAAFRTRQGELVLGGAGGFNLFDPSHVGGETRPPPVLITDFRLFDKALDLPSPINITSQIKLGHDQNEFSLEFAALSYVNAKKDRYAYRLEGYDTGWINTDGQNRRATYSNISPGEYTFRVKAANSDGAWNEKGAALTITVGRPFWTTAPALAAYALLLLLLGYAGRRIWIGRTRTRLALTQVRQEAMRAHEWDQMKIRFLTNVSNEFRTPLSMILAPGDSLARNIPLGDDDHQLRQVAQNANSLLHLVSQLLDFRKIELKEHKLNKTPGDIVRFIHDTTYSIIDLAGEKHIEFTYLSEVDGLTVLFDREKLGSILFNLLSNAVRITEENGSIQLRLRVAARDENMVVLEVILRDTGIGMASGMGMAITREFVELHGGSMAIDSELTGGRCFTILLPLECQPLLPSNS
jgi:ligand-binding sensor domain-containing protein/signal transduction histidine kinase